MHCTPREPPPTQHSYQRPSDATDGIHHLPHNIACCIPSDIVRHQRSSHSCTLPEKARADCTASRWGSLKHVLIGPALSTQPLHLSIPSPVPRPHGLTYLRRPRYVVDMSCAVRNQRPLPPPPCMPAHCAACAQPRQRRPCEALSQLAVSSLLYSPQLPPNIGCVSCHRSSAVSLFLLLVVFLFLLVSTCPRASCVEAPCRTRTPVQRRCAAPRLALRHRFVPHCHLLGRGICACARARSRPACGS